MEQEDVRKLIGARVRALRMMKGIDQYDLAYAIGMARSTLSDIEAGRENATIESIGKLACGLGVNLADFFDDKLFRSEAPDPIPARKRIPSPSDAVLGAIRRHPTATTTDIVRITGLSSSTVYRATAHLKAAGRVVRVGSPRTGRWEVVDGNVDAAGGARA